MRIPSITCKLFLNTTKLFTVEGLYWCLAFLLVTIFSRSVIAQENPFGDGWKLDNSVSKLAFQSLKEKDGIKREMSHFAIFEGGVDSEGFAALTVDLNSVDTQVDLRNVRMRFLLFETFKFPEASVSAHVEKSVMQDLIKKRRITTPVEFELSLHGIKKTLNTDVVLTMFADDQISVASIAPVPIMAALFDLSEGIAKLEDAAKVKIIPVGDVSFDFVFRRLDSDQMAAAEKDVVVEQVNAVPTPAPSVASDSTVVEVTKNFSESECVGRFEILSQTGAVYFNSGSSTLDIESYPLLTTVVDIVNRCPELNVVVAGHTDSVGSDEINLELSISRADSVMRFLLQQGISPTRVTAIGYGETRPVAPNDTKRNRGRNRRIEFNATNS